MSSSGYTYTDEAREYMFSPSGEDVIFDTFEIRHPGFVDDNGNVIAVRFVNNVCDITATLEEGAPMNAGEAVSFIATRFELVIPDSPQNGLPQAQLAVSNVSRELSPWLFKAVAMAAPIELSLRQYLADDLTEPCFVMHGLNFTNATASWKRVSATASIEDLLNFQAGRTCYTIVNSPGLNR